MRINARLDEDRTRKFELLLDRLGSASQRTFLLSMMDGAFDVFELGRSQIPHIAALMEKYADLPMDLADA
jgi:hypothetical protein